MSRFARNSLGLSFGDPYLCQKTWPEDCFVQCGGDGMVFVEGTMKEAFDNPVDFFKSPPKHYRTAFFEAFPKNPDTFIRGEGKTLEEAEENCYKRWQKILDCPKHDYEPHGLDGSGICKLCKLFQSDVLEPIVKCKICGKKRYGELKEDVYCREHYAETDYGALQLQWHNLMDKRNENYSNEQIRKETTKDLAVLEAEMKIVGEKYGKSYHC